MKLDEMFVEFFSILINPIYTREFIWDSCWWKCHWNAIIYDFLGVSLANHPSKLFHTLSSPPLKNSVGLRRQHINTSQVSYWLFLPRPSLGWQQCSIVHCKPTIHEAFFKFFSSLLFVPLISLLRAQIVQRLISWIRKVWKKVLDAWV
jgi:hypothetical protein